MPFFSKPGGALATAVYLLSLFSVVDCYTVDTRSCLGTLKTRVDKAMDEALAIVTYAEKRAAKNSPFIRQGTLLQDMLSASDENDGFALTQASSAFNIVKATIGKSDVIIHCNDKHLTKADGRNDLYFDNSDNRQARVQVLNAANRKPTACGGILRAFEYDFLDKRTGRSGGKAIVLCSDSDTGALKAADEDKDITFWRDRDMRKVAEGVDFFGRYLSYMVLHELFHAADETNFPVNPGGQAEKYGYQEITGHAVGSTGDGGPSSLVRLHNADSYALLACGYYMNGYFFEDGVFKLTAKRDRPPVTLRRRLAELKARARGGGGSSKPKPAPAPAPAPAPKPAQSPAPAPEPAPAPKPAQSPAPAPPPAPASKPPASNPPVSNAPPASSAAPKPASSQAAPSSQAPISSQAASSAAISSLSSAGPPSSLTSIASATPSATSLSSISTSTITVSSISASTSAASSSSSSSSRSSSSSVLPIETALGDAASKFPPIKEITFATLPIPDVDTGSITAAPPSTPSPSLL